MTLEDLGYTDELERSRVELNLEAFEIGRVITEHKERYIVKTVRGDLEAEITGNMRFTAASRENFPAVGDWVAITIYDSDSAIIHKILPRHAVISRRDVGHKGETQIIATNVDYAFLMQAVDRDFNINRLERYLTICRSSKVTPIVVLSKIDLIAELAQTCKFKDCTHTNEIGCSVLAALENGELERASYENYLKIEREKAYFETTVEERRKKERMFGKLMKNYKKDVRRNGY